MFSGPKSGWIRAALALAVALSCNVVSAQSPTDVPDEAIAAPITVRASTGAAQTATDKFLTSFIITAVRLEGLNFFACVGTASMLRPDLAGKIVLCALDIMRLGSNTAGGRLSFATIDQIVKVAVTAAPQSAADIVKAAIESEPYARVWIVAAAIEAAPAQTGQIRSAASQSQSIPVTAVPAQFNPAEDRSRDTVNSPEQPPGP